MPNASYKRDPQTFPFDPRPDRLSLWKAFQPIIYHWLKSEDAYFKSHCQSLSFATSADFTDVTLASEETDDHEDHKDYDNLDDHGEYEDHLVKKVMDV